ncbi:hypothetical protein FKM82_002999 [Ascaphus truei]
MLETVPTVHVQLLYSARKHCFLFVDTYKVGCLPLTITCLFCCCYPRVKCISETSILQSVLSAAVYPFVRRLSKDNSAACEGYCSRFIISTHLFITVLLLMYSITPKTTLCSVGNIRVF